MDAADKPRQVAYDLTAGARARPPIYQTINVFPHKLLDTFVGHLKQSIFYSPNVYFK
uniref:Uncharacterized protein n=1 Tax=Candidatus Berkiella aquae TaxID=295108 RepID=A0A0Q9YSL5_9GAMM